jgi:hypothetical protein
MNDTDAMIMQGLWAKYQKEKHLPARFVVPDETFAKMSHRQFTFQLPPEQDLDIGFTSDTLNLANLPDISEARVTVDVVSESQASAEDRERVRERMKWTTPNLWDF